MNQRGDTLRMFGVGKAFEETIRGTKEGKTHFGRVGEGGETFVMAFSGFTEEDGLDAATGTQSFFDEPDTLDANEAVFRGQTAAKSHAKLLEPAIVAAGEQRGLTCGASVTSGLAGRGHHRGG